MSGVYRRLMNPTTIVANQKQDPTEAMDVGAATRVVVHLRVLKAGSAGNIRLEHAAVNEDSAYTPLTGATWAADGTTAPVLGFTDVLRYLRWAGDGSVAGAPLVMADVVGKE